MRHDVAPDVLVAPDVPVAQDAPVALKIKEVQITNEQIKGTAYQEYAGRA